MNSVCNQGLWTNLLAVILTGWVSLSALSACSEMSAPVKSKTFVAVLVDLHLAESRGEIVGDLPTEVRDSVLVAHGVSSATYEAAVRYYAERPDDYLELYNSVIDSLSAELGELEESGQVQLNERRN